MKGGLVINNDELLVRLRGIEKKLNKIDKRSEKQWIYSLGFGAMVASLAVLPYSAWIAAAIFILGYLLMTLPPKIVKKL